MGCVRFWIPTLGKCRCPDIVNTYYIKDCHTNCTCTRCVTDTFRLLEREHSAYVHFGYPRDVTAIWTPYKATLDIHGIDTSMFDATCLPTVWNGIPSQSLPSVHLPVCTQIEETSAASCPMSSLDIDTSTTEFTQKYTTYYRNVVQVQDDTITGVNVTIFRKEYNVRMNEPIYVESIQTPTIRNIWSLLCDEE